MNNAEIADCTEAEESATLIASMLMDCDKESLEVESNRTKSWLDWCQSHKFVKCTEAPVPPGILPKGYQGTVIDVKVCDHKKRRVPDDKIYSAHEDLRMKVARGNSVLELKQFDNNRQLISTTYRFLIFALRKFSGGMGDEDDDDSCQNMWQNYFIKPITSAKNVIVTEKANGEAAHLATRLIAGQTLFCLGSKNVHLLVRNKEDIKHYTDSRYLVARVVAEAFFTNYVDNPEINQETKAALYKFMNESKSTAVFEILQPANQHVVDLSYLSAPELRFICWSENFTVDTNHSNRDNNCETLCLVPVNHAIDQAREFRLDTIDYEVIEASEAENYMAKIRTERDYEGKVLYFVDDEDKVFGLIKKKTAWYIILRAIREKCCHFAGTKNSFSKHEMETKINKRICEIQVWLGFSDKFRRQWSELGNAFAASVVKQVKQQNKWGIRSQFPQFWKQFLNSKSNEKYKTMYDELTYS